jgi:hypothetical protein
MTVQPTPPATPSPDPSSIEGQLARSLMERGQLQVDSAVAQAREDFLARMEQQTKGVEDEMKAKLVASFRAIGVSIIAVFLAAFSLFLWAQTRSAQEIMSNYQTSVLGLQREIMASQTTINQATRELAEKDAKISAAATELDAARKRLDQTTTEYAALLKRAQGAMTR